MVLSVEEAAAFLSVSTKTIRRCLSSGRLERRRVPGDRRVYVTIESVDNARAEHIHRYHPDVAKEMGIEDGPVFGRDDSTPARPEHQPHEE